MLLRYGVFLVAAATLAACGTPPITTAGVNVAPGATEAAATQLAPGMTRDQVTKALGAPAQFLAPARNVECLVYADRDTKTVGLLNPSMTIGRERLIVLHDGKLVENQLLQSSIAPNVGRLPGQATAADACGQSAGRYAAH